MSTNSNYLGRAFEYACLLELNIHISKHRPVKIDRKSTEAANRAWLLINEKQKRDFIIAADAFINTLFQAEPLILECDDNNKDILEISINKDSEAKNGDVRDIVISRKNISWDIGLSIKHNHFAAKHSRLSSSIDFGKKWYGIPCSSYYWNEITPIFDHLQNLKTRGIAWQYMIDKDKRIYIPLLNSFKKELERAYKQDPTITERLISYLLGIRDFYKVIAIDRKMLTEFQSFNLRGELNKNGKRTKASIFIPIQELPDEIIAIKFKKNSTNTLELYLNKGWTLSFRIHNASTIIEPSLKFDIQFLGVPSNIITINCIWR